jgi:hypothetical protein
MDAQKNDRPIPDIVMFLDTIADDEIRVVMGDAWEQTESSWKGEEFTNHDTALLVRAGKIAENLTQFYLIRYHEWVKEQVLRYLQNTYFDSDADTC